MTDLPVRYQRLPPRRAMLRPTRRIIRPAPPPGTDFGMRGQLTVRQYPDDSHEQRLSSLGFRRVSGIDEVGRGPLAGPVTAAAVVMPGSIPDTWFGMIRDSKQMSPAKRAFAHEQICRHARAVGVGFSTPFEIDSIGIVAATHLAMTRALDDLELTPDHLLIDALSLPDIDLPQTPIIKGDTISISIAAASIVAKVTRDRLMAVSYEPRHPGYGFARNKGYGTAEHMAALRKLGPCPIHRHSFAPVRSAAAVRSAI